MRRLVVAFLVVIALGLTGLVGLAIAAAAGVGYGYGPPSTATTSTRTLRSRQA